MRKSTTSRQSIWYDPVTNQLEVWDGVATLGLRRGYEEFWWVDLGGPTNPELRGFTKIGYV